MKRYVTSLVLSLVSASLVLLGTFDSYGFSLLLIFPIAIVLSIISISLKFSSGIFFRKGYWDILLFVVWFIVINGYSTFAYSRFYAGDRYWYGNIMFANQIITSALLVSLIFILIIVFLKRNKIKTEYFYKDL
ncbi:MAG: hypothetical protein ACOYOI_05975 [Chthoniobacterales bacterium]